jgi:hypothetical protein
MLWLTMATASRSRTSASVNSRPATSRIPHHREKAGRDEPDPRARRFFAIGERVPLGGEAVVEARAAVADGERVSENGSSDQRARGNGL